MRIELTREHEYWLRTDLLLVTARVTATPYRDQDGAGQWHEGFEDVEIEIETLDVFDEEGARREPTPDEHTNVLQWLREYYDSRKGIREIEREHERQRRHAEEARGDT